MAIGFIGCFNQHIAQNLEQTVKEANMNDTCNAQTGAAPSRQPTVGEYYDRIIFETKQTLERVTIAKAKAETLGMLNYPVQDLRDILGYVI